MANLDGSDRNLVKSLSRAFEILEFLAKTREPQSASQIGTALQLPISSTFALLKSMMVLGYVIYDVKKRTYFPSIRVTDLGAWIPSSIFGFVPPSDIMAALRDELGETVCLCVQNDLQVQFIEMAPSDHPVNFNVPLGYKCPLFNSAVGYAVLSVKPAIEVEQLASRVAAAGNLDAVPIDMERTMRVLANIKKSGFSIVYDEYTIGLGAIAWVVPTNHPSSYFVMSIGGPTERIRAKQRKIVELVTKVMKRFSNVRSLKAS